MDFKNKPILGMIHLAGDKPEERALEEINIMAEEGVDGVIIENYHGSVESVKATLKYLADNLFGKVSEPAHKIKIGINILPNEYETALQLADEFGADFIQLDFVSGRYGNGQQIDEQHYFHIREKYKDIVVLGGVWPKYYQPVKDSNLADDIEKGIKRAEAIVVTGEGTGKETPIDKIKSFRTILGSHPLIIGAGLTASSVGEQLKIADGAIVGSCFKPYGRTNEKISRELVKEFMDAVKKARQ